ncbi:MAG: STAS domain-containing protein [Ruminococcaceae bacterium]|nr:STAS domain-containing protein [Oscillospiraceae bacterium]
MDIRFLRSKNVLIIKVAGEIDHHGVDMARRSMDREIMKIQTKHVIFDFSELSFMDSSGIGMLMGRYRSVKLLGGSAGIVLKKSDTKDRYGMPSLSSMERILDMSGVFKCMTRYDDLKTAVECIGG